MNSLFWIIFEILINIYQGFIITYFTYGFLQPKNKKPFCKSIGLLWGGILAIFFTLVNYFIIFESLAIFIYVAVLFLYAHFVLEGSIVQKMFASLVPFEILSIVSILFINLFAAFFDVPLADIMRSQSISRFVLLTVVQVFTLYLFNLTLKHLQKDKCKLKKFEWRLIFIVLVISVIITAFLNHISLYEQISTMKILIAFSVLGLGLINVVVYYMIVSLSVKNSIMSENVVLKIKKNSQQEYIDRIINENEEAKKLRHDYKSNFTVLQMLITENKSNAALDHIKENITALNGIETTVKTKNDVVNAILNLKINKAKNSGIKISFFTISFFYGIDDIDLCNLLGNVLENAITSCEKCVSIEKVIQIHITEEDTKYTFNVKNSIPVSVLKNNPELLTTKIDKDVHGYGTKIIKDIAEKYNGKYDFYEEDNLFCCNVILRKNIEHY